METLLWILGIILVLYFLHSGWDSSYNNMVERMNEETDVEREMREAREQREKEEKLAKLEDALSRAKYALLDHPKYGTVTWPGKGRKPKWLLEYLEEGGTLEDIKYPRNQK
jgi:DNA-binding protein H-NS